MKKSSFSRAVHKATAKAKIQLCARPPSAEDEPAFILRSTFVSLTKVLPIISVHLIPLLMKMVYVITLNSIHAMFYALYLVGCSTLGSKLKYLSAFLFI